MLRNKKIVRNIILWVIATTLLCFTTTVFPFSPDSILVARAHSELKKHAAEFNQPKYAILIDYSKPVFVKRLWVLDLETNEIMLSSKVSHAHRSGFLWAKKFSNTPKSRMSCNGTFKTLGTYESNYGNGSYKIGMRIKGLEQGINHNAYQRNIVFHSSKGWWSSGCFMTPAKTNKKIIDLTKNGSIVIVN